MEETSSLSPALTPVKEPLPAAAANGSAAAESSPSPAFSGKERSFAWLLLAAGYFFWRVFPMSQKQLGAAVYLLSLSTLTFGVVLRGKVRFDAVQKLVALSALLAAAAALLWANRFLSLICFVYLMAAAVYLVYAATGNTLEEGLSPLVGADLLRAWFVYPFSSFAKLFTALSPKHGKGAGKTALKVLLGLFLAVIPTFLALSLLSYDSGFSALIERLFSFDSEKLIENLLRLVFGIPVAMYLFGLYVSSVSGSCREKMTAEICRARAARRRILPFITAAAAVLPLLTVYGVFFFSQWSYYTAAFSGVLPQGLSYAEYAREGFFQLCAVAGMNFVIMLCINRYVNQKNPVLLRTLCIVLALFTLILLGTAASKLWLYIARYGLTQDRVYAAWFMGLLAVLFVLIIVGRFVPSFKTLPVSLAVTVALFLLFALSGPNRWIAGYDVARYLDGTRDEIDVDMLCDLGDDAVPALVKLESFLRQENGGVRPDVEDCYWYNFEDGSYERLVLALHDRGLEKTPFFSRTLSSLIAERSLRRAGFVPGFEADEDKITLQIQLDLQEDIGLFLREAEAPGFSVVGGQSNADRTLIRRDELLYDSFTRWQFETPGEPKEITLRFSVVTEYVDPNFENDYPDELVTSLDPVTVSARFGDTVRIVVHGGHDTGYWAELAD